MSNKEQGSMGRRWAATDYQFVFAAATQAIIEGKITEKEAKERYLKGHDMEHFDKYLAAERVRQAIVK